MLKRKVWIASLLCTALLATGCSAAGTQTESVSSGELSTESESESGPVTKSITVVSITGNQLTYRVNEEETDETSDKAESTDEKADNGESSEEKPAVEAATEGAGESSEAEGAAQAAGTEDAAQAEETGDTAQENSQRPSMPSGEMPSGEMPSGEMPSGEMPSGEMPSGEMPSGEMPSGEMSSGFSRGNRGGNTEVKTIYLPVSVKVTTDTGKTKTYQILQAGDVLDVTFDTDSDGNEVITAITMTGTSNS